MSGADRSDDRRTSEQDSHPAENAATNGDDVHPEHDVIGAEAAGSIGAACAIGASGASNDALGELGQRNRWVGASDDFGDADRWSWRDRLMGAIRNFEELDDDWGRQDRAIGVRRPFEDFFRWGRPDRAFGVGNAASDDFGRWDRPDRGFGAGNSASNDFSRRGRQDRANAPPAGLVPPRETSTGGSRRKLPASSARGEPPLDRLLHSPRSKYPRRVPTQGPRDLKGGPICARS